MADNNFNEANSEGDNRLLTNPYAPKSGLVLKVHKIDHCNYLASVSYVVAAGGATTTITPITGNLSPDLEYYRVEIADGAGNPCVANSLDFANPANPFVIDTSSLDISTPWTLYFYGAEKSVAGDVPCELDYKKDLGIIGSTGGSGDTIPAAWENVTVRIRLTATDDPSYTLFPAEGVIVENGGTINFSDYTTDLSGLLVNGGQYEYAVDIKKIGTSPIASNATPLTNSVYSAFTNTVPTPYTIGMDYAEFLNTLTIDTSVASTNTEVMTIPLTNEGVVPAYSLTMTTGVA